MIYIASMVYGAEPGIMGILILATGFMHPVAASFIGIAKDTPVWYLVSE